ncbi:probable phospholipid-transporting ATPase IA [Daphnia pulex]|uniref:probable phospholipid-transporting ATPase IA n=1 Tax=Daphnia pulex TaxID=6669 RepID=UPI001EDEBC1E|nr:probable phospholipid-transporting ATPase IA [Daphnia pulex]
MIELWFAYYSAWSGQILLERWAIGLYNILFTGGAPLALGLFDWRCTAIVSYNYPKLYKPSQAAQYFNGKVFCYVILGNIIYTYVVVTVCLKAALETYSWTWFSTLAYGGSVLAWILFLAIYRVAWIAGPANH